MRVPASAEFTLHFDGRTISIRFLVPPFGHMRGFTYGAAAMLRQKRLWP